MASIEDNLKRKLYRAFCPESDELLDFHLGEISPERASFIQKHLKECPHCTREIQQTKMFFEETRKDLEMSLLERVQVLVARLVERSGGASGWSPAYQGVRGQEEHVLTYEAEGMQIILDIQVDGERSDRRAIYGLLIGQDTMQDYHARLLRNDELVASSVVDEIGNFGLLSIQQGEYKLILTGPEVEIRIDPLLIE